MNSLLKLNYIFNNTCENIRMTHNKLGEKNLRNKNLSIQDALLYRFHYSKIDSTKQSISSNLNFENNKCIHRTSYDRKENNIHLSIYKKLFSQIQLLYKSICKCNSKPVIAVDGTVSISNLSINKKSCLENSLNMGYYDVTNNIPIDLTFNGPNNKNKEIACLSDYIKVNKLNKDSIIVADRGYYKYELFNYLNSNELKYVIRLRDNSKLVNNIDNLKMPKNIRIVEYEKNIQKILLSKNKNTKIINIKMKYKLVTNLTDISLYSDNDIIDIYKSRWNVETFFKLIKSKFKFEHLSEKKEIQYKKLIYCELIILYIVRLINYIHSKSFKNNKIINKRNNKKVSCSFTFNESNVIDGIYKHLLKDIIYGTLTTKKLIFFAKTYFVYIKNETDRTFERISKIPFKKWYVKKYLNKYKYEKIIDAIENNKLDDLNKNLKMKAKKITVIK